MRIVVDLQACQSGSRLGGIGRYSQNLAEAMARNCGHHELRIILSELLPEAIPGIYERFSNLLPKRHIQVFQAPGPVAERFPSNSARARAAELIREGFIQQLNPDIIHIGSLIEGFGDDVVSSVGRLFSGDTTAVTLYDLIPLVEKDRYLTDSLISAHYYRKLDDMRRAGLLLAISEFSRQQAITELGSDPDSITNIAAGVDPIFRPREVDPEEASRVRERYGLKGKFLLYTSSFDQRKNHSRLVEAFGRLPYSVRENYQLLFIGNGWDEIYARLRSVGNKAGLQERDLVFAGHVPDVDLLTLYNLCDLFVFPSVAEGYGLPVLEAMACGIPTVASNTTSIPEVIGLSDALFDPYDIGGIADKIQQALTDAAFKLRLKEHGLAWSKNFTWDASAKRAISAFEAQYERNRGRERPGRSRIYVRTIAALKELMQSSSPALDPVLIADAVASNERCIVDPNPPQPRIGWVTTWNTRCGIAMYAKYLAGAHISDYMIFAPHEREKVCSDEDNVIRCWRIGRDDLRELAEQVYESCVDILVIQFQYGFFDFQALAGFLQEMVATGRRVYITMHATTDTATKRLGQIAAPLRLCDGVFVHSLNDVAALEHIGVKANVEIFPHGVVDVPALSVALSIPPRRFVIASYGFFLPHKGLLELIDVCHRLIHEYGIDVHLLMINAEYPVTVSGDLIARARARIAALGLGNRVTLVTEFLQDEQSLGYLGRADLIVYAYQETGESSSAAVRMGLAAQRPVAVTPLKIFDDVRDNVFSMPSTEIEGMADFIATLYTRLLDPDESVREVLNHASDWRVARAYSHLSEEFWRRLNHVSPQ